MQLVGRNKAAYSANLLHAVRRNTRSFIGRSFARPVGYCALRAQVGHRGMSVVPLKADIDWKGRHVRKGRVEDGRGSLSHSATLRFPSPLIEPDVPISGIRLSDWLHREVHGEQTNRTRLRHGE